MGLKSEQKIEQNDLQGRLFSLGAMKEFSRKGIADIFEALTAADRPYKKEKTLSESFSIMKRMKDTHHIDPDIFDVFVREGVFLDYAHKFLNKEQIDDVDIEQLLK